MSSCAAVFGSPCHCDHVQDSRDCRYIPKSHLHNVKQTDKSIMIVESESRWQLCIFKLKFVLRLTYLFANCNAMMMSSLAGAMILPSAYIFPSYPALKFRYMVQSNSPVMMITTAPLPHPPVLIPHHQFTSLSLAVLALSKGFRSHVH
jgi:hypothetical protein